MSVYSGNTYKPDKKNDAWSKVFTFIPQGSRVLDVGCSSGHLGAAIKKSKKCVVVGIDINKEDIKLAREALDEAHVIDLENDNVNQLGKFDVIIMADVIEHLVNPASVLKKLKSCLAKNGRLVFSIPNMANSTIRFDLLKGNFDYKDYGLLDRTHLHFYDYNQVNMVMREAGFNVEKMDCTIRSIPKYILKKELSDIGLDYSDYFYEVLHSSHGDVFQFIGIAKPGTPRKAMKIESSSSLDSITREIDEIKMQAEASTKDVLFSLEAVKKQNNELSKKIESINTELTAIKNSRSWKAIQKVGRLRPKVRRKS